MTMLTLVIFILILTIALFVVFYVSMNRKLDAISKVLPRVRKRVQRGGEDVVGDAHKKAVGIIQDASLRAQQILGETQFVDDKSKAAFEKKLTQVFDDQVASLSNISQELVDSYREAIAKLASEESIALKDVSESIKEAGLAEIGEFKTVLEKETVASQKIVEQKVEEDYARVRNAMKTYQQEMLQKLDARIYDVIQLVTKRVLGRAIDLKNHEELVGLALDEAKRQGGLSNG